MKHRLLQVSLLALLLTAGSAQAQLGQGELKQKLLGALAGWTDGSCSTAIMSTVLQYQCQNAPPAMRQRLKDAGPVQSIEFRGLEATPMGQAEVYLVRYSIGPVLWLVSAAPDGKVNMLYSPG